MKKWYQSKTIWFNIITTAIAIIGDVTKIIPFSAGALEVFGIILALGNVALRYVTTTPIA